MDHWYCACGSKPGTVVKNKACSAPLHIARASKLSTFIFLEVLGIGNKCLCMCAFDAWVLLEEVTMQMREIDLTFLHVLTHHPTSNAKADVRTKHEDVHCNASWNLC
eukprot:4496414-Amphidinium_carterae.1